jgi:hypothetical protein
MAQEVVRSDHRSDPRAEDSTMYRRQEGVDKVHLGTAVEGIGEAQVGWGVVQPRWK